MDKLKINRLGIMDTFTMEYKSTTTNIGFAKVWQDIVTSAAVHYQLWLGAGLFLKIISVIL